MYYCYYYAFIIKNVVVFVVFLVFCCCCCGSRIAQVRFKITHPGISIDVLASPCSPVLTAQPLDVVLRSRKGGNTLIRK